MRKHARLTGEGLTAFLPGYTETSLLFSAERMDLFLGSMTLASESLFYEAATTTCSYITMTGLSSLSS
jgi:hypothetical protein